MGRMTGRPTIRRVEVLKKADKNMPYAKRLINTDQDVDSMYKHLIMSTADNQEHVRQMLIATTFGTEYSKLDKMQRQDWNRCLMYARKLSIFSECLGKQVNKMKEKYLNKETVLHLERVIALKTAPAKPSQIPVFSGNIDTDKYTLSSSRCARWAEHPASKIPRWSKSLKLLIKREKQQQKSGQDSSKNNIALTKVSRIPLLVGLKGHIEKAKGVKKSIQRISPRTPGTPLPPIQKSSGFSTYSVLPDICGRKKSKTMTASGKKRADRDSRFAVKNIYSGRKCGQY